MPKTRTVSPSVNVRGSIGQIMIGRVLLNLAVAAADVHLRRHGRDLDAPVGERVGELEGGAGLAGRVGAELRGPEGAIGEVAANHLIAEPEAGQRRRAAGADRRRSRG